MTEIAEIGRDPEIFEAFYAEHIERTPAAVDLRGREDRDVRAVYSDGCAPPTLNPDRPG